MIRITDKVAIDENEVDIRFIRASGPGGQNVNKVETAVQLRFDVRRSPTLPADVRARLERIAGSRLTKDGVLVLTAQRHRTQLRNKDEALERLVALIRQAVPRPTPRHATKPTGASRRRRRAAKEKRAAVKKLRVRPSQD